MKKTRRILAILLACVMLTCVMPIAVSAAGTQDDPIDAAEKWMGYGVNSYILNPTIAENSGGMWYTLTAESDGILYLEHSYKNVDYTTYITLNGVTYEGGCVDGVPYNRPIVTAPIKTGDVATIQIVTKDAAAGTVYANMNVIAGSADDPIKVKSDGIRVVVGAGKTVYFQDDSLNAIYATKGLLVNGNVTDTTFYSVFRNSENGNVSKDAFTDADGDNVIETVLGGSLGGAGAPPVKPAWAIENNSDVDQTYILTLVDDAHECNWDDNNDTDCNTCGAVREPVHGHEYDHDFDVDCNTCGEMRTVTLPLNITGNSVSFDVNGIAWLVEAKVEGIKLDLTTANYENATVNGYKLTKMGAVVSNNSAELGHIPNLDDVDGKRAADVEAKYIYSVNEEEGTVTYAVRVINIPDEYKDVEIDILTYFIFQDDAGVEHVIYCNSAYTSYNRLAQ